MTTFWYFYKNPECGEVYNIEGSRFSNISMRKAIDYFKKAFGKKAKGFSLLCKPQKIYLENSNLLLY